MESSIGLLNQGDEAAMSQIHSATTTLSSSASDISLCQYGQLKLRSSMLGTAKRGLADKFMKYPVANQHLYSSVSRAYLTCQRVIYCRNTVNHIALG